MRVAPPWSEAGRGPVSDPYHGVPPRPAADAPTGRKQLAPVIEVARARGERSRDSIWPLSLFARAPVPAPSSGKCLVGRRFPSRPGPATGEWSLAVRAGVLACVAGRTRLTETCPTVAGTDPTGGPGASGGCLPATSAPGPCPRRRPEGQWGGDTDHHGTPARYDSGSREHKPPRRFTVFRLDTGRTPSVGPYSPSEWHERGPNPGPDSTPPQEYHV